MILRAEEIAQHLVEGRKEETTDPLVIEPMPDIPILQKSGAASVDVRLGCWFSILRKARMGCLKIANNDASQSQLTKLHYVPFGEEYYLHPGNFVLAITLEWFRFPKTMAGYIMGKSSWGRRGLIVATAAAIHPGFTGCLTLELCNSGEIPIAIKPGMRIGQICIHTAMAEGAQEVDRSSFIGQRKPMLGTISNDEFAEKLSRPLRYINV